LNKEDNDYSISAKTIFIDKSMSIIIRLGGIGIIAAILLILFYIVSQVLPLTTGASVSLNRSYTLPDIEYNHIALDEWALKPTLVSKDGLYIVSLENNGEIERKKFDLVDFTVEATGYSPENYTVTLGGSGKVKIVKLLYKKEFLDEIDEQGKQKSLINLNIEELDAITLADKNTKFLHLGYGKSEEEEALAGTYEKDGKYYVGIVTLKQAVDILGEPSGELEIGNANEFKLPSKPTHFEVSNQANTILVATESGKVICFRKEDGKFKEIQTFFPFKEKIKSMDFIFGCATAIFTSESGQIKGYSIFKKSNEHPLMFGLTKTGYQPMSQGAEFFARSFKNKAFITGHGKQIYLMYNTSEAINWQNELNFEVKDAVISKKYQKILLTDNNAKLHVYDLDDPHPEASLKAYFGEIWYEDQNKPEYTWESTGATEEAEKKLSMLPLIFGTIKATFYTMLFAVPIALMAAFFTSQFTRPGINSTIKPVMEIMASLPSVVIGFIAVLWLAPIVFDMFASIFLMVILIPIMAISFGILWNKLPQKRRILCKPGYEFIFLMPVILITAWFCWKFGSVFESYVFAYQPDVKGHPGMFKMWYMQLSGECDFDISQGNFALWWQQVSGLSYEQKNSLIVGFAMGFAVIPIIFTIAEDALSNVPKGLTSASMALGATRWQTAWKVVLPTAFPGIFSAIMVGLGRAVGETMIVLCAAGGIGVMEWNSFNGMRTLSMNLATELPEAPYEGTLYRTLFLGALLLFVMTFIVNTVAEIIRQKIRNKYKTV
jgi:phosphate transport system permease protein